MANFGISRETIIDTALRWLPAFDRFLMKSAATKEYEIFPNSLFPWTDYLKAQTPIIRAEAEKLLQDRMSVPSVREISPDHAKIAVDDKWRSFFLWGYGVRIKDNLAKCPETAKILENIPGLLTAFYSVMLKGAHVPRHTGPTKAILTTHLGLIIPREREKCHMSVGDNNNVVWKEGEITIFDDMFPHEVWNDTDEDRIILLVHIKRPLKFRGAVLRDLFFAILRASPFVRDGLRNLDAWKQTNAVVGDAPAPERLAAE